MGRMNVRLDDQLLDDCKAYCKAQGISMTDMIISGLLAQLQDSQGKPIAEIVSVASSGDTVYEPDPVKPAKQHKQSVSKDVAPVVQAMLSGVRTHATVQHHAMCTCAMCKPAFKGQAHA